MTHEAETKETTMKIRPGAAWFVAASGDREAVRVIYRDPILRGYWLVEWVATGLRTFAYETALVMQEGGAR